MYDDICIVIPSYEPNEKMIDYVRSLFECGMKHIVVVNDGSSKEYNCFFDEAQNLGAKVLGYEINKGKGYALKTAFSYIKNEMDTNFVSVLTKDDQEEIAALLAIPRPSLSRELINLRNLGYIKFDRKKITVLDIESLEEELFN